MLTLSETGKLMARYCIAFDTMSLFTKVTGTENLSDLVGLLERKLIIWMLYIRELHLDKNDSMYRLS